MSNKISNTIKYLKQNGFFQLFSANILIQLFSFASQLIIAGILSPEDIGRVKVIQTFLLIFSIIGSAGLNNSTLKLCSENENSERINGVFRSAFFFTIFSSTVVYLLIVLFSVIGLISADAIINQLIPIGLFPIITNSIFNLYIVYSQSTRKIKLLSTLNLTNKIISIFAIIILTAILKLKGFFIAYNLSFLLMIIVCIIYFPINLSFRKFKSEYKNFFFLHRKYAGISTISSLFNELGAYIDIFLISYLVKDMEQIGYYSFALTLTVATRIFPSTIQQITIPYFSARSGDKKLFYETYYQYRKILWIGIFIILLFSLLIFPPLLNLVFDYKYNNSMPYFYLLIIGWSIRQTVQLQSGAIFGLGKINYNLVISTSVILVNLAIYTLMINWLQLQGAAYASLISGVFIVLITRHFFNKSLKQIFR